MHDIFDFKRTLASVAYLLKKEDGKMSYQKLLSLLYVAERDFLLEKGYSLTGDTITINSNGPILVYTSRLLLGDDTQAYLWNEYLETDMLSPNKTVSIIRDPGNGFLSKAKARVIDAVYSKLHSFSEEELRQYIFSLEECKPYQYTTASVILNPEDIFTANNCADKIPFYRDDLDMKYETKHLLSLCTD